MDRITHPAWATTLDGTVMGGLNLRFNFEHHAAFTTHADLNRVHARADANNVGSQRVMEKVGMVREGVLRANRVERGETVDEAVFSVLRPEWKARSGR